MFKGTPVGLKNGFLKGLPIGLFTGIKNGFKNSGKSAILTKWNPLKTNLNEIKLVGLFSATTFSTFQGSTVANISHSVGRYFFEVICDAGTGGAVYGGLATSAFGGGDLPGFTANSYGIRFAGTSGSTFFYINGATQFGIPDATVGHRWGIAGDFGAGTMDLYFDGVFSRTVTLTQPKNTPFFIAVGTQGASGYGWTVNGGQIPFLTLPAGYKAWNNL